MIRRTVRTSPSEAPTDLSTTVIHVTTYKPHHDGAIKAENPTQLASLILAVVKVQGWSINEEMWLTENLQTESLKSDSIIATFHLEDTKTLMGHPRKHDIMKKNITDFTKK